MKALILASAVLFYSSAAYAQQTGNGLLNDCKGNQAEALSCQVYFVGFYEGFVVAGGLKRDGICIPSTVTTNQVRAISEKYFRDHPDELHLFASVLIKKALRNAFACKTSQ
jgi:hypothetical protein